MSLGMRLATNCWFTSASDLGTVSQGYRIGFAIERELL